MLTGINPSIVAVHGLGSSVETTWTHKQSGKLWLRDFLHLDFPKARIMTYCHNTSWQSQALGSNLSDHGAQLLGFLEGERNTEEVRLMQYIQYKLLLVMQVGALKHMFDVLGPKSSLDLNWT